MAAEQDINTKLLVVLGPTATGKSELAVRLAEMIGGEIVNADSMQVYRGMDIGTAKPSADFRRRVPHHLMDIVAPDVNFTAADFRREARHAIAEILARGRKPILVGGTGLYLKVLLQGLVDAPPADEEYRRTLREIGGSEDGGALLHDMLAALDPVTAVSLHPNDQVRIIRALEVYRQSGRPVSALRREHAFGTANYSCLKIGISVPRDELYRRIENRVDAMIADGFVGEVRGLLSAGFGRELKSINSIGYREMSEFIDGGTTLDEAVSRIKKNTRNYAKRQETWFRRDEEIYWVDYPETFATILNHVIAFYD